VTPENETGQCSNFKLFVRHLFAFASYPSPEAERRRTPVRLKAIGFSVTHARECLGFGSPGHLCFDLIEELGRWATT
jgi:hypothetical protein